MVSHYLFRGIKKFTTQISKFLFYQNNLGNSGYGINDSKTTRNGSLQNTAMVIAITDIKIAIPILPCFISSNSFT